VNNEKRYTVWVGGVEVNDNLLTQTEAIELAQLWSDEGYNDTAIEEITV
jgi:hypothetical protein